MRNNHDTSKIWEAFHKCISRRECLNSNLKVVFRSILINTGSVSPRAKRVFLRSHARKRKTDYYLVFDADFFTSDAA